MSGAADVNGKVKVMKVVPTLLTGGTEGQAMTLSRSLDPGRFDLEFSCLRKIGPFVKELDDRRIPLAAYPLASFYSVTSIAQQARFMRHLIRRNVQIVHAYSFYGNVFATPPAKLAGVPVVIASIRDLGAYLTPKQATVQRHICRFADCVLVNADAVRDWLISEGYNPAKIVVIRNGVDLDRFSAQGQPARLRADLGVPADTPIVAVVSRLNRLKGLEQFLEAASLIAPRFPKARFLIVGETPPHDPHYLDQLKSLAERLGIIERVIFMGLRADVPMLLASVSVAVMPSLNEALSNSLLESMAAGAPVVATRVGGTPEALVDGQTGLLVPPADVRSLASSIAYLLETPALAAQLGLAARRLIEERFSIARMAATTSRLYEELLIRKKRVPGRHESREPLNERLAANA